MKNITIIPGNLRDITFIAANMRDSDWEEIDAATHNMDKATVGQACGLVKGVSWTVWWKDHPVLALGWAETALPHIYSAWSFGTDRTSRVIPHTSRFIVSDVVPILHARGCTRVEVRVMATHVKSIRWLQALGLETEAEMINFGKGGETFLLMSWTGGLSKRFGCVNDGDYIQHVVGQKHVLQQQTCEDTPSPCDGERGR